jgi:hypothetical protein
MNKHRGVVHGAETDLAVFVFVGCMIAVPLVFLLFERAALLDVAEVGFVTDVVALEALSPE